MCYTVIDCSCCFISLYLPIVLRLLGYFHKNKMVSKHLILSIDFREGGKNDIDCTGV
jgi:hypothetical protein